MSFQVTPAVNHSPLTCPRRDREPCSICEYLDKQKEGAKQDA